MPLRSFSSEQRLNCLECLSQIGKHKIILSNLLSSQKLSDCMMDDYSDINFQDEALSSFMSMIGAPIANQTSLSDLVSLLPRLQVDSKFKEKVYGHLLDKILLAVEVPGGTKYLDQIFKYLQLIPIGVHLQSQMKKELHSNGVEGDMASGMRYSIGISYQHYHFEEPQEFGPPEIYRKERLCESNNFIDLMGACENSLNASLMKIMDEIKEADEHIYNLISFHVTRDNEDIISFPVGLELYPWSTYSFDLSTALTGADILAGKDILRELSGKSGSCNASRLVKGRLLEIELGM